MHGQTTAMQDSGNGDRLDLGGGTRVDRYQLWPAAFVGGEFSVPDAVLSMLWRELEAAGKHRDLFYNGHTVDADGWIEWLKRPGNHPVLVVDTRAVRVVAVAWLNNVGDGAAMAHFCMFGLPRPEIGEVVLRYWSGMKALKVLVGFTPETNVGAVRYAEKIGFKRCGYIPLMCNMVYLGRRVGAVVTSYLTQEE